MLITVITKQTLMIAYIMNPVIRIAKVSYRYHAKPLYIFHDKYTCT